MGTKTTRSGIPMLAGAVLVEAVTGSQVIPPSSDEKRPAWATPASRRSPSL